ncbi:GNAT family N-acetyltransferase [Herbiconiux moechotypicola]|uniref:N-acetyltransferase domain-containing protein n=1 Tax=Herbiconiux moechotypicola TaxID=637393 RepID=A0ABP5QPV3_9MICO|nr:GNAT family N-acetyltransferase [Herbiconiux moechotypicola]MCS5731420.1 GNAT family N-acetyltransferase [Herbiconiux moechotypicola]
MTAGRVGGEPGRVGGEPGPVVLEAGGPGAVRIRTATGADRRVIDEICRRTGDAGGDARGSGIDLDELVARYVDPYLELEPALAVVGETAAGEVVGYALGTVDTATFARRWRGGAPADSHAAHVGGGAAAERERWAEELMVPEIAEYPSHLHIDLLPEAQGRGLGRRLIEEVVRRLTAAGSSGVHLGVDPRNAGALTFYPRVGFTEVRRDPEVVVFVRGLTPPRAPTVT